MFKNLILILIFWFLILQNIALANKFKVKDLEIDLFDKNKQIENSKYIREAFGRVEIKIFAEKTDDENIGPIIFILKSRFEKYGLEVRKFYLDYFFNNKLAIFNNESANYQTIDKKKTNAFQVKEFELKKFLNTSDDFMEVKRAIKGLYKKNSIEIDDRLLKSDHLYSISNGYAVWVSYMYNYENIFKEDTLNNGLSKFHPDNINNFPSYKNYMNKWIDLAFKRHQEFQDKLNINSKLDLKSMTFDSNKDLKHYEEIFYINNLKNSSSELEKEQKAKKEKEQKAKEEKKRKAKEEKERKAKEEQERKAKEQKAKEEKERKAKEEKERKAKEEKEVSTKPEDELSVDDLMSKIKELNEMYKSGVISKEEFEMLKNKLLKN